MLAGVFYLNLLLQLKPFRGLLVEIDRDTPYEFVDLLLPAVLGSV